MPASPEALTTRALQHLERLVGFDTTSRGPNLELIGYVEAELAALGVAGRRTPNADGTKTNLYATLGPVVEGGVVLSGHTDVVPVDGQPWTSDPWTLTRRGDRLHGRGACDMKGFLALALAAAPEVLAARPARPVHLAFSYDEEVGCLGAPDMIADMARELPRPAAVIVGEPTDMQAVSGHKGVATFGLSVRGREGHSSLPEHGVSAIMEAVPLLARLHALAERLRGEGAAGSSFDPPYPTLTVGLVHGGTAGNILARELEAVFDLRTPPGLDPMAVLAPFLAEVSALDARLKARAPEAGAAVRRRSLTPALAPEPGGAAEALARRLAGDNGPARGVSYGTEAGQFQGAGWSVVVCGPGSIEQAHQADEYVELAQMQRGAAFMARLGRVAGVRLHARADGRFVSDLGEVRCALGRGGVVSAGEKREGDGATPLGVWPLRRVLWRPDRLPRPATALPTAAIAPADGWSDDPADPLYNRPVSHPHPHSAERLWREDELYDVVVVLGHNDDPPLPGLGSAVFLHCAKPGLPPTEGCVALRRDDLLAMLAGAVPGDALEVSQA